MPVSLPAICLPIDSSIISRFFGSRSSFQRVLAFGSLCVFASQAARADTYTWRGGAANNNWSTAANWLGNAAPPSDLDNTDLIFGASDAIFPSITPAYSIHSLTWNAGASAYFFDSGPLTLGSGGFTQNAANTQTFSAPVILGADQTWNLAAGTGALTLNGGVNTTGGPGGANRALTINAATTSGSGNVVNGNLTGGGSLTKTGAGILSLSGAASTYSGGTTISAGTLAFNNAGALGTGAVTLNGGELRAVADASLTQLVAFAGSTGAASAAPNTTLTLNSIGINAGTANFGAPGQTGVVVTGALISANDAADQRAVAINAGTLRIGSSANGGQGLLALSGAGTTIAAGATLDLNGVSATVPGLNGAGSVLTGNSTSTVLTVNAGNFSGAVSGSGALTKTTAGTLTLTGASTYTGATTVNGGALAVGSGGSVTGGSVTVNAGGALAVSGTGKVTLGMGKLLMVNGTSGSPGPAVLTLTGNADLSTRTAYVGVDGVGSVTQSGGIFSTNLNQLILGNSAGSSGAYTLTGGNLSTTSAFVGAYGAGSVTQSGGTFATNGSPLYLGYYSGSSGAYTFTGGSLLTGTVRVGFNGSGAFTQSGGTLLTNNSDIFVGSNAGAEGTYHLDGGTLAAAVTRSNGTGVFNFNGGTLQARRNNTAFFQGLTTANVRGGGAVINTAGFNVTVAQNLTHSDITGDAALDGGLTKNGAGTLTLTGTNTFTGPVAINAGTLAVAAESALGAANGVTTVNGGGQLFFTGSATLGRTYNLGVSTLAVGSGQTLTFASGLVVNGGFLAGPGTDALGNGATLNAVRIVNGAALSQSGGTVAFNNVLLTGVSTFTQAAGATLNATGDFTANSLTALTLNGTVNAAGGSVSGLLTINNGGVVNTTGASASPLYLDGSRGTTVNAGGQLNAASGSTVELGGLLVNNGAQSGVLNVNLGGVARGSGSFGTVNVGDGGRFGANPSSAGASVNGLANFRLKGADRLAEAAFVGPQLRVVPGTANVGSLTLNSGSLLAASVQDARGAAGAGYDTALVQGALTLNGYRTAGDQITIALSSLGSNGSAGAAANFDPSQSYVLTLVTASGGITGFDAASFQVDTSSFQNSLGGGHFFVAQDGNNLNLDFTPVPEPATWLGGALLLAGAGFTLLVRSGANGKRKDAEAQR